MAGSGIVDRIFYVWLLNCQSKDSSSRIFNKVSTELRYKVYDKGSKA